MMADPAVAHAQTEAPNQRQDDFDMAKLKKSLDQNQKRSMMSKSKAAKLTPAEIRSLNYSAGLSKSSSARSSTDHSARRFGTPPLTPDDYSLSQHSQRRSKHSSQRRASVELPTPPTSPDRERRESDSSARQIHAPTPIHHASVVNAANVSGGSRPASASSYRGVATYRGPEMTRTGSLTVLPTAPQQIVSNPLSQFSRPRQSTLPASSPQKTQPDVPADREIVSPVPVKHRHQSLGAVSHAASRDHSPVRPSDSPVSMDEGKAPRHQPATVRASTDGVPVLRVTPRAPDDVVASETDEPSKKQKLSWRKTLTGTHAPETEPVPLRKEHRRRSLMAPKNGYCVHAVKYSDTIAGPKPEMRDSLKDELPSAKTAEYQQGEPRKSVSESEYGQHPAVRPLNTNADESITSSPSTGRKGKEREDVPVDEIEFDVASIISSVPSYSRCSCCGRVQRPGGFESDLSPVLENENLRTNFNFEAQRMSVAGQARRSMSMTSNQGKYTPIIPMDFGTQTRQARIEPAKKSAPPTIKSNRSSAATTTNGVVVNKAGDIIGPSSVPLAIMPKSKERYKVVRFSSLHKTPEERQAMEEQRAQQTPTETIAPAPQLSRFGSLYGMRNALQESQAPETNDASRYAEPENETPRTPVPHTQSAYQAQISARQSFSSQTNTYQPLRSSRLAYHENVPISPTPFSPIEKSFQDSSDIPLPPASPEFESEDDEPMVDLSSFDGSFVHNSLSRSATMLRGHQSPPFEDAPQTPVEQAAIPAATNGYTHYTTALQNEPAIPHPPLRPLMHQIDTSIYDRDSTYSSRAGSIGSFDIQTAQPLTTTTTTATTTTIIRPTTIVRLIPSDPVSVPSSPKSVNSKGQLKLGDWILPEGPQIQSAAASARASISSGNREVGVNG